MKKNILISTFTFLTFCLFNLTGQVDNTYKDPTLNYSFKYPKEYKSTPPKNNLIDFTATDGYGGSIVINNKDFPFSSTPFDQVTKKTFEDFPKPAARTFEVTKFYRTKIDNYNAIIAYCTMTSTKSSVKQISVFVNYKNYNFTLILGTLSKYFEKEEANFIKSINSIKFKV